MYRRSKFWYVLNGILSKENTERGLVRNVLLMPYIFTLFYKYVWSRLMWKRMGQALPVSSMWQYSRNYQTSYSTSQPKRRRVRRISGLIYEETRDVLKVFLENIMRDAVTYTRGAPEWKLSRPWILFTHWREKSAHYMVLVVHWFGTCRTTFQA